MIYGTQVSRMYDVSLIGERILERPAHERPFNGKFSIQNGNIADLIAKLSDSGISISTRFSEKVIVYCNGLQRRELVVPLSAELGLGDKEEVTTNCYILRTCAEHTHFFDPLLKLILADSNGMLPEAAKNHHLYKENMDAMENGVLCFFTYRGVLDQGVKAIQTAEKVVRTYYTLTADKSKKHPASVKKSRNL